MKKVFFTRLFLLLLMVVGMVPCVWADQYGHEKSSCFSAYEKSPGVIHFKILMARKRNGDDFRWLASACNYDGTEHRGESYVYMSYPGNSEVKLFHFYSSSAAYYSDQYGDNSDLREFRFSPDRGQTVLTTKAHYKDATRFRSDVSPVAGDGDEEALFVEFDWYMPMEYGGISGASFSVKIECKGSPKRDDRYNYSDIQDNNTYYYTLLSNYTFPDANEKTAPDVTDPQIAVDLGDGKAKPGQLMTVMTGSKEKIYNYQLSGEETTHDVLDYTAMVYIDSRDTVRTDSIKVWNIFNGAEQMSWDYDNGKMVHMRNCYTTYEIFTKPFTVPAYHKIYNFNVDWNVHEDGLRHGDFKLQWEIKSPKEQDIMPDDLFEIQRATKSDFSDAESIDIVFMNDSTTLYTYIDSSDVARSQKSNAFYYRIRRASGALWDWDNLYEPKLAAQDSIKFSPYSGDYDYRQQAETIQTQVFERLQPYQQYIDSRSGIEWLGNNRFNLYLYGENVHQGFDGVIGTPFLEGEYAIDPVTYDGTGVAQPTVEVSTVTPDANWTTNRQVKITAFCQQKYLTDISKINLKYVNFGSAAELYFIEHTIEPVYASTSSKPNIFYWDKDNVKLNLIRHEKNGTNEQDVRIQIPNDSIVWNADSLRYDIHYTDVASTACTEYTYSFVLDTTRSVLPLAQGAGDVIPAKQDTRFYFDGGMIIDTLMAADSIEADYTHIEWTTKGGDFDYYIVRRRLAAAEDAKWDTLTTECTVNEYFDRTAPVGKPCVYEVTGVLDCNGQKTDTKTDEGTRSRWGSIAGRVAYPSGAGCPGVQITISDTTGVVYKQVLTDEKGNYVADSVEFADSTIYYTVMAMHPTMTAIQYLNPAGTTDPRLVQLNGWTAHLKNINFTNASGVRFTGRVLYEGSTVPVHHAQFKVNGDLQLLSDGTPIESDASGNFELLVPGGEGVYDSVQVVMEGHTFLNDGFIQVVDGTNRFPMDKPVDGARMYDLTKAKMIGRVVGGLDEGQKRLGYDESVNNIGDSITLVLELEGDNISHLVHNPRDLSEKERDTTFLHFADPYNNMTHHPADKVQHFSHMHMTQKRITIHPDPVSGEYQVDLYPVRYRVVQVTANGYSTLFPEGTTSQTIDLSRTITSPNCTILDTVFVNSTPQPKEMLVNEIYSITYRAPIEMKLTQVKGGVKELDYYGETGMYNYKLDGSREEVSVLKQRNDTTIGYLFGYPIFQSGNEYYFKVHAREVYRYNNDPTETRVAEVPLRNNDVVIFNGLSKQGTVSTATLNNNGDATFKVKADNPTFILSGEEALRTVEVRTVVNGLYLYTCPLRGFVVASDDMTDGVDASSSDLALTKHDMPFAFDVVRDPYGAGSSAWIEEGTKYTSSQNDSWNIDAGITLTFDFGSNYSLVNGVACIGPFAGVVQSGSSSKSWSLPISTGFTMKNRDEYSYTLSSRVSTSSATGFVGSNADVYIGSTWKAYAHRTRNITLLDSMTYRIMHPAIETGQIRIMAEQQGEDGKAYYLAVREILSPFIKMEKTTFNYTQQHIIQNIIPELLAKRDTLLMFGTEAELQALADSRKRVVYQSLVSREQPNYGIKPGEGYKCLRPQSGEFVETDEVNEYNNIITEWMRMIITNEQIKLDAAQGNDGVELDGIYSLSAGATRTSSVSASYASDFRVNWNGIKVGPNLSNVFDNKKLSSKDGTSEPAFEDLSNLINQIKGVRGDTTKVNLNFPGVKTQVKFAPLFNIGYSNSGANPIRTYSKSTGYTLSVGGGGYEDIAVYRRKKNTFKPDDEGYDFNTKAETTRKDADGASYADNADGYVYADYIFIREGGATRCPYEGADVAIFHHDSIISPATLKIDNPKLTIDTRELSNIPADEAATFVLTLANETEVPGFNPSLTGTTFWLSQVNSSNTNGLTITMDGSVITDGRAFVLKPGESVQKTIKVYRGTGYDFEDVQLALVSDCQSGNRSVCTFSVHYQPVSCPVSMTLPVDKWILNTLAPKDDQGYYLPVEITGFNVNYDEFDHIELQYKLQTQGDDRWVNLCSYYADSALFALASGNKQMIENGQIRNVKFYGERDPMEQQYDLRAVSFCRLGNGFVTRASEVRSGLKDTRVPRLFGAPTPADGILGVGDYISIPYSEAIAANYLDEDNNFDITGYTNSSKASTEVALYFAGDSTSYGFTEVSRDLSGCNFSMDVMVCPEALTDMTYFTQGNADHFVSLGQYAEGSNTGIALQMCQTIDGVRTQTTVKSVSVEMHADEWIHVAATYDSETGEAHLYLNGDDKTDTGKNKMPAGYKGIGKLFLGGRSAQGAADFQGKMVEARLWKKALTFAQVRSIMSKRLTGYEHGLYDYFPLSEGRGEVALNKANSSGAMLYLKGLNWVHPEGYGLRIGKLANQTWAADTLSLDGNAFPAIENGDYSLTFWYRTDTQEPCTLFQASNFRIEADSMGISLLKVDRRETVHQETAVGNYLTGEWHQLALSCSKLTGYGSLFIDGVSVLQFNAANFDSPNDSRMFFGPMLGAVDDLTYWNIALPTNYLQEYFAHSPNDKEMGLITHVSFSERLINDFGVYNTYYCPYNLKQNFDEAGQLVPRKPTDRVVLRPDSLITKEMLVDNAPVADKGDLVKMNFTWVGKDNELVIDLNMLDKEINKQNIFVTVRDVEDLAGNPQASPITMTIFVDRNQLRWSAKYLQTALVQGEGERLQIDLVNNGGTNMNYYIEDTPWWITPSVTRGQLSPLEKKPISLLISDKLDPGEYETLIYLTDENGLSEPLRVMVQVKAIAPNWAVDPMFTNSSTGGLFAQVQMLSSDASIYYDTDTADIVAAFLQDICIGISHITYENNFSLLCLGFHGSDDPHFTKMVADGEPVRFLLWQASTGQVYALNTIDSTRIYYQDDVLVGTPNRPVQLRTSIIRNQLVPLQKGWNWISFYIDPDRNGRNFADALTGDYEFHDGDFIKWANVSESYEQGEWIGLPMQFYKDYIYMIRVGEKGRMGVFGSYVAPSDRAVTVRGGWNHLPYINEETQDINTALASYRDLGKPGDVVKSYSTFAMLDDDRHWVGSLTHLQPGVGYMLYRQDSSKVVVQYQTNADQLTEQADEANMPERLYLLHSAYSHNMPLVASVEGAAEGDLLTAYVDNQVVGMAEADAQGRFMMLTSTAEDSRIYFRYQSADGVQTTAPQLRYQSTLASVGTVSQPYPISFQTDMATAYPDPFVDHITYSGVATEATSVEITLYSADGHSLWHHSMDVPEGVWQLTQTGTTAYPQGLYIAVIRTGDSSTQVKLIKE